MSNLETVQQIYAAFGRGDVPGILAHLAEDVDWEYGGGSADEPLLQPRRGRSAVPGFFEALSQVELTRFEPKAFFAGEGVVLVLIDVEATVKATGRKVVEEDEIHIWRFGADGKVSRFRHRADTYQWWAAFHDC